MLSNLDCFQGVPAGELEHLVDLCYFRVFLAREMILSENKTGEFLYLLIGGNVRLTLHDRENKEVLLGVLGAGDCCGEGLLFSDFFRSASAYAETPSYTLQLPLVEVRSLLATNPTLRDTLHRIHLRRLVERTLAHGTLFSQIWPMERLALAAMLEPVHYPRHTVVIQHGESGQTLSIIESGQVLVEQDGQPLALLQEGDFFGDITPIPTDAHHVLVRTLTPVDVLALPSKHFFDLIAHYPHLETKLTAVIEQRRTAERAHLGNEAYAQWLTQVIAHGVFRGSHLLVRTPLRCPPGCTICEDACRERHGYVRLHLNGVTLGTHDILDACRQCRVGAECVEACPEQAFEWSSNGALVITERCTGCGDCIPACPYTAITRVLRDARLSSPVRRLWRSLKEKVLREESHAEQTERYLYRADTCDLCSGYERLACLEACPTDSLRLLPVVAILKSSAPQS